MFLCLAALTAKDDKLKEELTNFIDAGAKNILKLKEELEIQKYIKILSEQPTMKEMQNLIRSIRVQRNTYSHPRKIVITAFKPLVLALTALVRTLF